MNLIRKLRSKFYHKIIEVNVPVRFYWEENRYDGFEFGPLDKCTKYQIRLLREIIDLLFFEHDCALIATYMRDTHSNEWMDLLDRIESESAGIPKTFFDAFREDTDNKEGNENKS